MTEKLLTGTLNLNTTNQPTILPPTLPYPLTYPTLYPTPYPIPYPTLYPNPYPTLPYPLPTPYPTLSLPPIILYRTLPPTLNRPVNLPSLYFSHVRYSLMSVSVFSCVIFGLFWSVSLRSRLFWSVSVIMTPR